LLDGSTGDGDGEDGLPVGGGGVILGVVVEELCLLGYVLYIREKVRDWERNSAWGLGEKKGLVVITPTAQRRLIPPMLGPSLAVLLTTSSSELTS
jgi:hypothetical protein